MYSDILSRLQSYISMCNRMQMLRNSFPTSSEVKGAIDALVHARESASINSYLQQYAAEQAKASAAESDNYTVTLCSEVNIKK